MSKSIFYSSIIKVISNRWFPLFIIAILPAVLVTIWFRGGDIYGTGESGLPFYDFNLQHNINKDAWAYYTLGHPINIGTAAAPTYWFFAQLQNLGIPTFILQAVFMWIIFLIAGLAIYKLVRDFFPNIGPVHAILAVLFYWFNPFSLVNVWNRFLNNFFVFYALLPLTVYLLYKGLKEKNYIFAIFIGIASAVLSYALTSVAFVFMLWGVLFYLGIFYFLTQRGDRLFILKFFLVTLFFWFLMNFWWINQVFSYLLLGSFNAVVTTSFKLDTNYNTFSLLSERLGILSYIFRMKHATFFTEVSQMDWVKIYAFPLVVFFEFLISVIFLLPLIVKKRTRYVAIMAGLFFISIFLTKGNNPPLGEIFDKAFSSFSFLQLFRNPFEKIGFILSFSAAVLFAEGCFVIEKMLGKRGKIITRLAIGLFLIVIWGFPFWTGYVFTNTETPVNKLEGGYRVKVPTVYKEVSDWLSLQGNNFRLVVLPIGGEGITYTWEKGYTGVELTNQLFPKTAISFNTNIPFYDDISSTLERLISTRESLGKIIDILNSKYVLVRKDLDWKARGMRNPNMVSQRLEKIASTSSLEKIKEVDNLTFWEHIGWQDKSIYVTTNLVESKPMSPLEDILNAETEQSVALYNSNIPSDHRLTKYEIIHPNYKFSTKEKNVESSILLREDIVFPAVNILPSSPIYPLILVKEKLEAARLNDQNSKVIKRVSLLGKRLVEADKESKLGRFDGAVKALSSYQRQLRELSLYNLGDNPNKSDRNIVQEELYEVFSRHSELLIKLVNIFPPDKKNKLAETQKVLDNFLLESGIKPIFGYLEKGDYPLVNRVIYQFTTDQEGSYELLFNIPNWNNYFKKPFSEPVLLQVDNSLITRRGELKKDGLLSFGFLDLSAGDHEIGFNTAEPLNLVDVPNEISMEIEHGVFEKSFPIKNFDPYSTYVLSVDYLIKKGSGALVSIEGNNDPVKKGIAQRQFRKNLASDAYNYELKEYTAYYVPTRTSDTANLIFTVYPWNNCQDIYRTNKAERCEDENFRRPYDRKTEVVISNVSLTKIMTEIPFLKLKRSGFVIGQPPQVSFKRLNNSKYEVDIKNAKEKYALILSELYDPAWTVLEENGVNISRSHFLANSYANGWIIDKNGDYKLIIKFIPQDLLEIGRVVSIIALIFGLSAAGFIFYIKLKK